MAASLQLHLTALATAQARLADGRERLRAATTAVDDTLAVLERALDELDDGLQAAVELQPALAERLARADVAAPPWSDGDWGDAEAPEAPGRSYLVDFVEALAGPDTTMLVLGPGGDAIALAAARKGAPVVAVEPAPGDAIRLRRQAVVDGLHTLHVAQVDHDGCPPLDELADAFGLGVPGFVWFDPGRAPLRGRFGALGYGCYQVESNRLTALRASDVPWEGAIECLAASTQPAVPPGWALRDEATEEDALLAIVAEARHKDPARRAALASRLASAPEDLRTHPMVAATIEELANEAEAAE